MYKYKAVHNNIYHVNYKAKIRVWYIKDLTSFNYLFIFNDCYRLSKN